MRRFWNSRGIRKFRKNRLAVISAFFIGLYVLAGVLILVFNVISLEETAQPVGPRMQPGFGGTADVDTRLDHADFHIGRFEQILRAEDFETGIYDQRLGEKHLAAMTREELAERVERYGQMYTDVPSVDDPDNDPDVLAAVAELEAEIESCYTFDSAGDERYHAFRTLLGTDRQGRSILVRALYSIKVAAQIGMVTALISVLFGSLLGAAAGFFGGWVDGLVIWLYSTLSAVPYLVLLVLVAYLFTGTPLDETLIPVYAAFCLTFWIGPCRVIRGETLKLKELEYVQAATAVGFSRLYILIRHVLPNTAHLMFINFSLLFIGAIKAEVILSFLGLGVQNEPSWGVMINHSKQEVLSGFMWQIGSATFFMFVLVLAFNILTDALQDAFDPKHV